MEKITFFKKVDVREGIPSGEVIAINSREDMLVGYIRSVGNHFVCDDEYSQIQDVTHWLEEIEIELPSDEQIEIQYPCELGQQVIMENDATYNQCCERNYRRREGAKYLRDKIAAQDPPLSNCRFI